MKKLTALLVVLVAVSFAVSACTKSQDTTSTDTSSSATTAAESATPAQMAGGAVAAKLPIPLAKLPSQSVAPGNASAGAQVFAANCASCHGEGGKNGTVGPTLAGAGLKAGQVAYMVRHPQGVEKDSSMPKLPLSDKQVADVAAYVASLK
ncbi:MAG TPA: cytochrome c [Candidatus Eremiobacteraceae bacterium]|nr:cytochrome c [Candidatus Eremiobacteraceae bacterium]